MTQHAKPWAGRFSEATDKAVEAFTASIAYDRRLYRHDIEGSTAHARMLGRQGIISPQEVRAIVRGLAAIQKEIDEGTFDFRPEDEDIHMAIEKALRERIGDAGAKLHAGRSRNDQVALDTRLYLREEMDTLRGLLRELRKTLLALAKREKTTLMPGYTHLQRAQPVLLAHHLLAYEAMFGRDEARLADAYRRVNVLPLGAAALAGSSLPLDRAYVARLLKFLAVSANRMDTVADRDYIAEFLFVASCIMMHLSRFSEDLILWSSGEFRFVEISDAFTTGSSIMPQKKNPDVAELVRGKTGRVYGDLMAILTLMKGLPMTYNRDMQEDKEALFDAVDTAKASVSLFTAMLYRLTFNRKGMADAAAADFSTATDLAEYLVMKGVPFRECHHIAGSIVGACLAEGKTLFDLTLADLRKFYKGFDKDVFGVLTPAASVARKATTGSTSGASVARQIADLEKILR